MLLEDKIAVVYGAGGQFGGGIARAFAAQGARVYLTGHRRASVELVAKDITAAGGFARVAEVNALDETAIDAHLQSVIDEAGRLDISFNAIGLPTQGLIGVPLANLDADRFTEPVTGYIRSYFLTARLAARHMIPNGSGVIMTITALPAKTGTPLNGGYGAAQAAKEALTRDLSVEFAPQGLRVVSLRSHGIPESRTMRDLFDTRSSSGLTWEQFHGFLAGTAHTKRVIELDEVANTAVFAASDMASGLTGTTINLTMGATSD